MQPILILESPNRRVCIEISTDASSSGLPGMDEANTLITDAEIPQDAQDILKEHVGELLVASVPQAAGSGMF